MEELRRHVSRAHRRLLLQQFLTALPWSLFIALVAAAMALLVPKLWPVSIDPTLWIAGWVGGSFVIGILAATIWTFAKSRSLLDAAIEVDRRFALKERISSTLALSEKELESEIGRALVDDTLRRIGNVDVRERFAVSVGWRSLLPFAPAILIFLVVLFMDDAQREDARAATATSQQTRKQIKVSTAALKKKIEQRKKEAEAKGLEDAEALLKELERGLDKLNSDQNVDRQKALIKINELTKELEKRREQLGGTEQLRKQLDRLKDVQKGPADRVAKAMQQGDFKKAVDEIQSLADKIEKGELSEAERDQLAKQLEEMKKELEKMVAAQEQAKRDLQEQIEQLEKSGDRAAAGKLQQKLDQLNQQNAQMERMQQMASQLGQAAQSLKDGNSQQAGQQLEQLADQMGELQDAMDELETIGDVMDQIADAKAAMNCPECMGDGCTACQGFGMGMGYSEGPPGMGMGEGSGQGERPEERTDTSPYESRVAAQPQAGEAIRTGDADGPNLAGRSQQQVREEIQSALSRASDPLTDQRLPRDQREHARQYFERFHQDR